MESQDFEDREAIPRAENLLLSLEELLDAGLHIGTRIKTVDMEKYIFRVRPDGLFILNIGETNEKIRVAAKFMARFEPGRVLAVSSRLYGKTPIDRFAELDRKSTRLNSSHVEISYAVFCLKKKKKKLISNKVHRISPNKIT